MYHINPSYEDIYISLRALISFYATLIKHIRSFSFINIYSEMKKSLKEKKLKIMKFKTIRKSIERDFTVYFENKFYYCFLSLEYYDKYYNIIIILFFYFFLYIIEIKIAKE